MGIIKDTGKVIVDDIKKDINTIKTVTKRLEKGEPMIGKDKVEHIKEEFTTGWGKFFKENWTSFLIWIGFFLAGYFYGGNEAVNMCNQLIAEEFSTGAVNVYDNLRNFTIQ